MAYNLSWPNLTCRVAFCYQVDGVGRRAAAIGNGSAGPTRRAMPSAVPKPEANYVRCCRLVRSTRAASRVVMILRVKLSPTQAHQTLPERSWRLPASVAPRLACGLTGFQAGRGCQGPGTPTSLAVAVRMPHVHAALHQHPSNPVDQGSPVHLPARRSTARCGSCASQLQVRLFFVHSCSRHLPVVATIL